MELFSSKYKHNTITHLQIYDLNEETKVSIWNFLSEKIIRNKIAGLDGDKINKLCEMLWTSCLSMPYDTYAEHYNISYLSKRAAEKFTKVILKRPFYILFDCIECMIDYILSDINDERIDNELKKTRYLEGKSHEKSDDFGFFWEPVFRDQTSKLNSQERELDDCIEAFNTLLDKYLVGYRIIDGKISKLTGQNEIEEFIQALDTPLIEANMHINKAHNLLSNPKYYDYQNSIKEAISALETMARYVTGVESDTLSECIKKMDKIYPLHPALKESILKLYGYCSDCAGIRHGSKPGHNVYTPTVAEAKFMLVICSSLNNFLLQMAEAQVKCDISCQKG